jgi:hypothetical protein
MKDFFNKILTWVKANLLLAIGILFAVILLFFPKVLKGLTGKRRIRHRPGYYTSRARRRLPRSVGTRRIRKQYTKGGKAKKPWQIKGSEAARRHMRRIRSMR